MRIAFVTRQFPPAGIGGIGSYVATVSKLLAEAGHDVTVVSSAQAHRRTTEVRGGVVVERFPALGPRRLWQGLGRRWPMPTARVHGALSAAAAVRRSRGRFDVLEAPEWKAEGLLLPWCGRGRAVVHLHLSQELVRTWIRGSHRPRLGGRVAEWLERRSISQASAVTATSALSSLRPDRSAWIAGLETTLVAPPIVADDWSDVAPVDATEPTVVFAGHLEDRKAPELLVEACAQLLTDVPDLRLVLAGRPILTRDGRRSDEVLRELAAARGLVCEVVPARLDPRAMRDLYGRARVVAVPSRYETLSMVALEALASGRPAIVTDAVGAAEWIAPTLPELVVPAGDVNALARAMRPFLTDAVAARRVGSAGMALVRRICSPSAVVDSRVRAYRMAVREGRRRGRSGAAGAYD